MSPGCISARNTPWLAWLPELGCTLAKPQPNSSAGALDRELLGDIDELAAAVIAPARIAFGIFVGQHRALRLEHGARDDVLRGDQLDLVALAAELELDRAGDLRIGVGKGAEKNELERIDARGDGGLSGDVHGGGPSVILSGFNTAHAGRAKAENAAQIKRPPEGGLFVL